MSPLLPVLAPTTNPSQISEVLPLDLYLMRRPNPTQPHHIPRLLTLHRIPIDVALS